MKFSVSSEAAQLPLVLPERESSGQATDWLSLKREAKSFAASTPPKLRVDCAKAFCAEAVAAYCAYLPDSPRVRRLQDAPSTAFDLGPEGIRKALMLGKLAAQMRVEAAAYAIGSTYAVMLPDARRSRDGVFYTPPPLVEYLLDRAEAAGVDWERARVLDPACGGGAFLGPVVRRIAAPLRKANRRVAVRSIGRRLSGFEIDPFSAWMSLVFFDITLHQVLGYTDSGLQPVEVCNSLEVSAEEEFDLVVGNPPYGRVRLSTAQRERFSRSLFGHANMYALFLDLAARMTVHNGVVAYVTPTSFLGGEYYKRLRSTLANQCPPTELNLLHRRSGIFDDVLQETLLAVFKKGGRRRASVAVRRLGLQPDDVEVMSSARVRLPLVSDKPWIIPRYERDRALVRQMSSMPNRLSDWGYKVSTGPLVWNRHKERLRDRPGPNTVPLIWAEAVTPDGTFVFRALRRNHAPYLVVQSDEDPVVVKKPCVLLQRTTSKEQPRRLIAAELPPSFLHQHGAVAIENHLNMLQPLVDNPPVDTATLARFLNSELADRIFRCISGSVAVSAYELEAMPLPAVSALNSSGSLGQCAPLGEA